MNHAAYNCPACNGTGAVASPEMRRRISSALALADERRRAATVKDVRPPVLEEIEAAALTTPSPRPRPATPPPPPVQGLSSPRARELLNEIVRSIAELQALADAGQP